MKTLCAVLKECRIKQMGLGVQKPVSTLKEIFTAQYHLLKGVNVRKVMFKVLTKIIMLFALNRQSVQFVKSTEED